MYNPKSKCADDFINHEEIVETLAYAEKNKENRELIQETAEELKTLTEESLTEESAESRKACLEKIRELAERLVAASGADACGK